MAEEQFADFVVEQDFTEVKAWDGVYSLPDPGEYVVDVVNLQQKPSKNNISTIYATFTIAAAEDQISEAAKAFAGQKLWGYYSLSPNAQGRIKSLMVACGANLQRFVASEIMGSRLIVTVTHTKGDATTDENGNPREPKTFANVGGERPLETAQEAQPEATTPPVLKKSTNGAKAATAARRA